MRVAHDHTQTLSGVLLTEAQGFICLAETFQKHKVSVKSAFALRNYGEDAS